VCEGLVTLVVVRLSFILRGFYWGRGR
jgi:hypothetical protein